MNPSNPAGAQQAKLEATATSNIAKTATLSHDINRSKDNHKNGDDINHTKADSNIPSFRTLEQSLNQMKRSDDYKQPTIRNIAAVPNPQHYAVPSSQPISRVGTGSDSLKQTFGQYLVHPVPTASSGPYSQLVSRQQFAPGDLQHVSKQTTSDSILALEDILDIHLNRQHHHELDSPPKPQIIRHATTSSSTGTQDSSLDPNWEFTAASALFHAAHNADPGAPRKRARKLTKRQTKDLTPDQVLELKKRYKCNMCSKCFIRPSSLTQHMRSHTGEHPFNCRFCNKAFSVKSNWRRHERLHETHGDVLPASVERQEAINRVNSEPEFDHDSESEIEQQDTLAASQTQ